MGGDGDGLCIVRHIPRVVVEDRLLERKEAGGAVGLNPQFPIQGVPVGVEGTDIINTLVQVPKALVFQHLITNRIIER
jgi:hypothetical protein